MRWVEESVSLAGVGFFRMTPRDPLLKKWKSRKKCQGIDSAIVERDRSRV